MANPEYVSDRHEFDSDWRARISKRLIPVSEQGFARYREVVGKVPGTSLEEYWLDGRRAMPVMMAVACMLGIHPGEGATEHAFKAIEALVDAHWGDERREVIAQRFEEATHALGVNGIFGEQQARLIAGTIDEACRQSRMVVTGCGTA